MTERGPSPYEKKLINRRKHKMFSGMQNHDVPAGDREPAPLQFESAHDPASLSALSFASILALSMLSQASSCIFFVAEQQIGLLQSASELQATEPNVIEHKSPLAAQTEALTVPPTGAHIISDVTVTSLHKSSVYMVPNAAPCRHAKRHVDSALSACAMAHAGKRVHEKHPMCFQCVFKVSPT